MLVFFTNMLSELSRWWKTPTTAGKISFPHSIFPDDDIQARFKFNFTIFDSKIAFQPCLAEIVRSIFCFSLSLFSGYFLYCFCHSHAKIGVFGK